MVFAVSFVPFSLSISYWFERRGTSGPEGVSLSGNSQSKLMIVRSPGRFSLSAQWLPFISDKLQFFYTSKWLFLTDKERRCISRKFYMRKCSKNGKKSQPWLVGRSCCVSFHGLFLYKLSTVKQEGSLLLLPRQGSGSCLWTPSKLLPASLPYPNSGYCSAREVATVNDPTELCSSHSVGSA